MTKIYESWSWIFNGRCQSLLWQCVSCSWAVLLLSGGTWWIRLQPLLCLLCLPGFNYNLSLLRPLLALLLGAITLIPRGVHQRLLLPFTTPWLRRFLLALSFVYGWQILCEVQQRRSLLERRGPGRLGTGLGTPWKAESGSHVHRWQFHRPTPSTWCCEPLGLIAPSIVSELVITDTWSRISVRGLSLTAFPPKRRPVFIATEQEFSFPLNRRHGARGAGCIGVGAGGVLSAPKTSFRRRCITGDVHCLGCNEEARRSFGSSAFGFLFCRGQSKYEDAGRSISSWAKDGSDGSCRKRNRGWRKGARWKIFRSLYSI